MLLTGLGRLCLGIPLRDEGRVDKSSADSGRLKCELVGLIMLIEDSESSPPCFADLEVLCSCSLSSCLSMSCTVVLVGMKSQIDEVEVLDSLRMDGSGVLPLETHTPSTSTPRSSALMPNGTSSARGTPGPRRFWLISRCRACSVRSLSATAEYLCRRQCVCANLTLPRHIVRAMPQPSIWLY